MGAISFENEYRGTYDAAAAYVDLVEQARYEHGHGGYTGTIAETDGCIRDPSVLKPIDADEAYRIATDWDREPGPHKWGPAWFIPLTPNEKGEPGWLFFGVASC